MTEVVERKIGLPFTGFQSSAPRHMIRPDKATADSRNMLFDPNEGKFFRRKGFSNDSFGGSTAIFSYTGPTPAQGIGAGALRARWAFQHVPPNRSSSSTTYGALFSFYASNAGGGTYDAMGGIYIRDLDNATNTTLGSAMPVTTYASTYKIIPMAYYLNSSTPTFPVWHRLRTFTNRLCPGARSTVEIADWQYLPARDGVAVKWNRQHSAASGAEMRIMPWGHIPPLAPPTIAAGTAVAGSSWSKGDTFFVSCLYKFKDGSYSMPFLPRPVSATLTGGLGAVQVGGAPDGTTKYQYITWSNIPIGPEGVVARYLLRTPKYNTSPATGVFPALLDLRIAAIIPNNTQTSWNDYNGTDTTLVNDPLIVRFDHVWARPGRHTWQADHRIFVGNTKICPAAIVLAPNLNVADTSASISTDNYEFTMSGTTTAGNIVLKKNNSAGTTISTAGLTIQDFVDNINATTSGGSGGAWVAALVPGSDPSAAATNLLPTGSCDTADQANAATGRVRAYALSYPAISYFNYTYAVTNNPETPGRFWFTIGGPGSAPYAGDAFAALNNRTAPTGWGRVMGGGALGNGCIIPFSNAIALFINRKGGKSGLDEDYRLEVVNENRGCIADGTVIHGNGWVGYMTAAGFTVTDGEREVVISQDVWNSATQTGEWAYEIAQSQREVLYDVELSYMNAAIMNNQIHITYRSSGGTVGGKPDLKLVYDFSQSAQAFGLNQVLRPDGTPWGWSTPLTMNPGGFPGYSVMREVLDRDSGAIQIAFMDTASVGFGVGAAVRIDSNSAGDLAGVIPISSLCYGAMDFGETLKKKRASKVTVVHKTQAVGGLLKVATNKNRVGQQSLTLPTTSGDPFGRSVVRLPQSVLGAAEVIEVGYADAGQASPPEFWGAEVKMKILDSVV